MKIISTLVIGLFLLSACTQKTTSNNVTEHGDVQLGESKLLSRDEFKNQLKYRSPATVIDLIGKPDSTSENADMLVYNYDEKTIDPVTEKVDHTAKIIFINQEINSINFY